MSTSKPKHILVATLDWGLGHTTRCIPIIGYLLSLGHVVTVAGNQSQRTFIEETFSGIDFIHLEGYNITYSKWNKWAQAGLLSQMPGIIKTIKEEHTWLQKLADEQKIDGIISDNRYGLYHKSIPSVIITHQVMVRSGFGNFMDHVIQKIHFKLLERFSKAWVVDVPGSPNLGGVLAHAVNLPFNAEYIGLLSRFSDTNMQNNGTSVLDDNKSEVVIMLSGPEPQRSELSQLLWRQACCYPGRIVFIEGSENAKSPENIPAHINYQKRLGQKQIYPLLRAARVVICRSGYSSLMDLVALNKRAILIPTPGQTEQIYLAKYLHKEGLFYAAGQKGFDLARALKSSESYTYKSVLPEASLSLFKEIINKWCDSL